MTTHDLEVWINGLSEADAIRFADWCDSESVRVSGQPIFETVIVPAPAHSRAQRAADRMAYRFGDFAVRLLADRMPHARSFDVALAIARERASARSLQAGWLLEHTRREITP